MVAPRKTLVREISCDLYQENNLLPAQAVEAFISNIESSADWQQALTENGAFEKCQSILRDEVAGVRITKVRADPEQLIAALRQAAMKRHGSTLPTFTAIMAGKSDSFRNAAR